MELAELAGVSREFISKLESGRRRLSPGVARRTAAVFGLSLSQMWGMFYREEALFPDNNQAD